MTSSSIPGIDFNRVFGRTDIADQIKSLLTHFDEKCRDPNFKKGIYIYGSPGCGKTFFVAEILKSIGYDAVNYDAGDVRNKSLIDNITNNHVARYNVLDMMLGKSRKIAIVMDEIDGMHKGDKGGVLALVKLIRQKKTKKQKTEHQTMNPIICIGNYYTDKKICELMKVCNTFELPAPTDAQMREVVDQLFSTQCDDALRQSMVRFIQGDFRKLQFLWNLATKKPEAITKKNLETIFHAKYYNEDYANIVEQLFRKNVSLDDHNTFMNENDRTTVSLLWHENVVDRFSHLDKKDAFPLYQRLLDNICYADYIYRITFQSQIWIFNEMSSLLKTFYNNKIYHDFFDNRNIALDTTKTGPEPELDPRKSEKMDIRFTKILTKYSTEYGNSMFYLMLAQEMDMDKKDVAALFQEMRLYFGKRFSDKTDQIAEVEKMFQNSTKIKKLDIKRMYKFLDKNVKLAEIKEAEEDLEDFEMEDSDTE